MSDGPGDMNRELEKKAAAMVEKCCRKCDYRKCNMGSLCLPCSNNSNFTPSRAAIEAKLEELRNQTVIKQEIASKLEEQADGESESSKENLMDEAIKYFEIIATSPAFMNPAYLDRIERMAKKCQHYKDISSFLKSVKSERAEMIELLKEWKLEIMSLCEGVCCYYTTSLCNENCNKFNLKTNIEKILKKAEGK